MFGWLLVVLVSTTTSVTGFVTLNRCGGQSIPFKKIHGKAGSNALQRPLSLLLHRSEASSALGRRYVGHVWIICIYLDPSLLHVPWQSLALTHTHTHLCLVGKGRCEVRLDSRNSKHCGHCPCCHCCSDDGKRRVPSGSCEPRRMTRRMLPRPNLSKSPRLRHGWHSIAQWPSQQ
jgi:hypothetical protein